MTASSVNHPLAPPLNLEMGTVSHLDGVGGIFEDIDPKAWRQGADLAIEMFDQADINTMSLDPMSRDAAQDNAVYRALCRARQAGEPQLKAFCAVLTEIVCSAAAGVVIDSELLEDLATEPVPQRVMP